MTTRGHEYSPEHMANIRARNKIIDASRAVYDKAVEAADAEHDRALASARADFNKGWVAPSNDSGDSP